MMTTERSEEKDIVTLVFLVLIIALLWVSTTDEKITAPPKIYCPAPQELIWDPKTEVATCEP